MMRSTQGEESSAPASAAELAPGGRMFERASPWSGAADQERAPRCPRRSRRGSDNIGGTPTCVCSRSGVLVTGSDSSPAPMLEALNPQPALASWVDGAERRQPLVRASARQDPPVERRPSTMTRSTPGVESSGPGQTRSALLTGQAQAQSRGLSGARRGPLRRRPNLGGRGLCDPLSEFTEGRSSPDTEDLAIHTGRNFSRGHCEGLPRGVALCERSGRSKKALPHGDRGPRLTALVVERQLHRQPRPTMVSTTQGRLRYPEQHGGERPRQIPARVSEGALCSRS